MQTKLKYALFFLIATIVLYACEKQSIWNLKKLPEFETITLKANNLSQCNIEALLSSYGYDNPELIGFCWSDINTTPTIEDQVVNASIEDKLMAVNIPWTVNQTIYIRAFVKNSVGIVYSDILVVSFPGNNDNLPVIVTNPITETSFYSCKLSGTVVSNGGLNITEKGFCFSSSSQSPTLANSSILANNQNFDAVLNSLNENTTYYVRAYAKNLQGVGYGAVMQTTTLNYYELGETGPAGGLVFYSKPDTNGGWNFLEAAPQDIGGNQVWYFTTNTSGVNSTSIGSGTINTQIITSLFGAGSYAAYSCSNINFNGYGDWFLPSRNELMKIRENLFINQIGGLSSNQFYWCSSEDSNFPQNAWAVKMTSASENTSSYPKTNTFKVRPIRRF
jgi:hypothetical protein